MGNMQICSESFYYIHGNSSIKNIEDVGMDNRMPKARVVTMSSGMSLMAYLWNRYWMCLNIH